MNHTKTAALITIYRILVKANKHYCHPSVNSIIDLICKRHHTNIHRRWAFQCLHDIEAAGYITRRTRFKHCPDGGYIQETSLISITLKGARHLFDLGVEGAQRLTKEILGWIKGGDTRFPEYKKQPELTPISQRGGNPTTIANVLSSLGIAPGKKQEHSQLRPIWSE